jgi:hypothetical protein
MKDPFSLEHTMAATPVYAWQQRLTGRRVSDEALARHTAHFRQTVLPRIEAQAKAKAQGAHEIGRKILF